MLFDEASCPQIPSLISRSSALPSSVGCTAEGCLRCFIDTVCYCESGIHWPCVRSWVLISSSSMVPNRRDSINGFHQSTLRLDGPTIATISPSSPRLGVMGPAEAPGPASDIGTAPSSSDEAPGASIELPSTKKPPSGRAMVSSLSWIEGLNKYCVNTPEGGGSQFNPSRARASTASLSHQRT
jgi:hypothetical protein